ncbi:MAG: DUF1669 domain-containing protein [Saprospiraceae bacterium]|nr:DUF1669 domain-containing protein [Saprospiraceae bacterium]
MPDNATPATHFTNIRQVLRRAIRQAENEVFVAVAWFTDDALFAELLAAQQRGVQVEVALMNDEINRQSGLDYAALETAGIAVWCYPEHLGLMHHKFCVVDESTLLIGSYNWTRKAAKNEESLLEIPIGAQLAADFRAEFERIKQVCVRLYAAAPAPPEPVPTPPPFAGETLPGGSLLAADLRVEILFLELETAQLEAEKNSMETVLLAFERRLRDLLGDLLARHLDLQRQLAERKAQLTGKRQDQEQYEQREAEFRQFREKIREDAANPEVLLDEPAAADLKQLYREAVLLAHPDRYGNDPQKEAEANALMAALTEAYRRKDLEKVREIWLSLKNGTAFRADWAAMTDIEQLQAILTKLKKRRAELAQAIADLQQSEAYRTQQANPDAEAYAAVLREQLERNIQILENEINQLYP